MIRMGFWGILYYNYHKDPPPKKKKKTKIHTHTKSIGNYLGPCSTWLSGEAVEWVHGRGSDSPGSKLEWGIEVNYTIIILRNPKMVLVIIEPSTLNSFHSPYSSPLFIVRSRQHGIGNYSGPILK